MLTTLLALSLAASLDTPVDMYGRPLTDVPMAAPAGLPANPQRTTRATTPQGWHLAPYRLLPKTYGGTSLAVADFTGDGRPDLITTASVQAAQTSTTLLRLYTQDVHGNLYTSWKHHLLSYPQATVVPVAFGRGRSPSLAVVTNYGIHMLMGWSAYGFTHSTTGTASTPAPATWIPSPRGDAGALITGGNNALRLHTTSDGALTSNPFPLTVSGYEQGAVADIDGDGDYDFAFAGWLGPGQWAARVLRNTSVDSTWSYEHSADISISCVKGDSSVAQGIAFGDFNGDGHVDLAISQARNSPRSCIGVAYGDGTGTFSAPLNHISRDIPQVLHAADINGDGLTDLLVLHGGWATLGVYLQQPDGTLAAEQSFPIPYVSHYYATGIAVGDLVGDRCPDVAIAQHGGAVLLLEGRQCLSSFHE